jgi:NAD(P)-dependent dehydrogenase (short-subunit alcohol dehydrogenase family)
MILQDKVALVTEGTSGIGRATAIVFGAAGAKVVFSDIRNVEGEETADLIRETGAECLFVKSDVSGEADVRELVQKAIALSLVVPFNPNPTDLKHDQVIVSKYSRQTCKSQSPSDSSKAKP